MTLEVLFKPSLVERRRVYAIRVELLDLRVVCVMRDLLLLLVAALEAAVAVVVSAAAVSAAAAAAALIAILKPGPPTAHHLPGRCA